MRSADRPILVCIFLLVLLWPAFAQAAMAFAQEPPQTVILENFGGEGSFTDGYDFSERAAQRWLESGPDNPSLNPDFYLNEFASGIFGPSVHPYLRAQGWVRMINYGQVSLDAVSAVPSQSDSGFVEQGFVVGYTYGLFAKEGNYVALHVNSQYPYNQIAYGDWYKNGIEFSWRFVSGGEPPPTGVLSVEIFSDKTSYLGETPQISGIVTLDGKPVYGVEVCVGAYSQTGQTLWGICYTTDSNGQFFGSLELPRDYYGSVKVTASVQYSGKSVSKDIWITILQPQLPPLQVELGFVRDRNVVWAVPGQYIYLEAVGRVTSNGFSIRDATVQLELMGQTYVATSEPDGRFYYSFETGNWRSGVYTLKATASKEGYMTTSREAQFTVIGKEANLRIEIVADQKYKVDSVAKIEIRVILDGKRLSFQDLRLEVTKPSGRVQNFEGYTVEDGTWQVELLVDEAGTYSLVARTDPFAFFEGSKQFIGEKSGPPPPPPPVAEGTDAIVDVAYPHNAKVGDKIKLTGRLVRWTDGKPVPRPGCGIALDIYSLTAVSLGGYQYPRVETNTDQNGGFSFSVTMSEPGSFEVIMSAYARDFYQGLIPTASFRDYINVALTASVTVRLSSDVYTSGEILQGTVEIATEGKPTQSWQTSACAPLPHIQIIGPKGGAEITYVLERFHYAETGEKERKIGFEWTVPFSAEEGKYEVRVNLDSPCTTPLQPASASFFLDRTIPASVSAHLEPPTDSWSSGFIVGTYTDFQGAAIPDADVTIEAYPFDWWSGRSGAVTIKLAGSTDNRGEFRISLEEANLVKWNPPHRWIDGYGVEHSAPNAQLLAYATRKGYSTGMDIVRPILPTLFERIDIVGIDPSADYLNQMVRGGGFTAFPFTATLKIRYNLLADSELKIDTTGDWSIIPDESGVWKLDESQIASPDSTWKFDVRIQGNARVSRFGVGWLPVRPGSMGYPVASHTIPLPKGINKEIEVAVQGTLYDFEKARKHAPQTLDEAWWRDAESVSKNAQGVTISLSNERLAPLEAHWPVNAKPSIGVRVQQAWVGPATKTIHLQVHGKSFDFENANGVLVVQVFAGDPDGGRAVPFPNHELKVELLEEDLTTGTASESKLKPTSILSAHSGVNTDDEGWIVVPLTFKQSGKYQIDPDKDIMYLSTDGSQQRALRFHVKISSPELEANPTNPIELLYVPDVTIGLSTAEGGLDVIQTIKLGEGDKLTYYKPMAVRVYVEVTGDVDREPAPGDKIDVQCTATVGGLEILKKTVTLRDDIWYPLSKFPNVKQGERIVPVDFVFTPTPPLGVGSVPGSRGDKLEITVTLDPKGDYGKEGQGKVTVKSMKTTRTIGTAKRIELIFSFVNFPTYPKLPDGYYDFILRQTKFLLQTYPTYDVRPRWDAIESREAWLTAINFQIASGLFAAYSFESASSDADLIVVGVLPDAYWSAGQNGAQWSALPDVVLIRYNAPDYVLAHEIGHSYGLYKSWAGVTGEEQYDAFPTFGIPVHGYVLKDDQVFFIPDPWDEQPEWNPLVTTLKHGTMEIKVYRYNDWRAAFADELYDLMGNPQFGAQEAWIIYPTYKHLLGKLNDPPTQDALLVSGGIFENGTAILNPPVQTQAVLNLTESHGDYELRLVTSSGEVRYSVKFGESGKAAPFVFRLPLKSGTAKVLLLDKNGKTIAEASRSPHPPTVQTLTVDKRGGEIVNIKWKAEDTDGNALSYSLAYSCDGGLWIPIAVGMNRTEFELGTADLPGGRNCTVKVIVSDGFNTAYAISKPFEIDRKPPKTSIFTQAASYQEGEPIWIEGTAYSAEEGFLPSRNLKWTSNVDGFLGNGTGLEIVLSPGSHTITLEAVDSTGAKGISTVTITVEPSERGWKLDQITQIAIIAVVVIAILAVLLLYRRRRPKRPAEQPTKPTGPARVSAKSETIKYCIDCGVPIETDAKYCEKCGASQMQGQKQKST